MLSSPFASFVPSPAYFHYAQMLHVTDAAIRSRPSRFLFRSILPTSMTSHVERTTLEECRGIQPISKSENIHSRRRRHQDLPNSQPNSQTTPTVPSRSDILL